MRDREVKQGKYSGGGGAGTVNPITDYWHSANKKCFEASESDRGKMFQQHLQRSLTAEDIMQFENRE